MGHVEEISKPKLSKHFCVKVGFSRLIHITLFLQECLIFGLRLNVLKY